MKRVFLALLTVFFLAGTQLVFAQGSSTQSLFEKYSGKDGYTSVSISKELFGMFAEIDMDDPDMKEAQAMMEQLQGIRILMYETKEGSEAELQKFRGEIGKLKVEGFTELMEVKESDEEVKFLAKKKGDKISELLLVINGKDEAGFISITGIIDMNTIGKLSKSMHLDGMEKLEKLNGDED